MPSPIASLRALPREVRWGLLGVVALYLATVAFNIVVLPWRGAADSYDHMDYIWQVWNGHLPAPYGHELPGMKEPDPGGTTRHATASHPPLYYLLMAGLVGPLLDSGAWESAVLVTRIFNALVGLAILGVAAWLGWRVGGRLRAPLAIALPATTVLVTAFMKVAGDSYNDAFATLWASVVLACAIVALLEGPRRTLLIVLGIAAVLGVATRSTIVVTAALGVIAVIAAFVVHRPEWRLRRRIGVGVGYGAAVLVAGVAAIGWYFLFNLERSGSWFRSRVQTAVAGREKKSLLDNLSDPDFYLVVPGRLLGLRDWNGLLPINFPLSLLLSAICIAGLVILARRARRAAAPGRLPVILVVVLAAVQLAGLYAMQLQHATGWGLINIRYFLPGLLIIGMVLAVGSLGYERARGWVATAVIAVLAGAAFVDSVWFLSRFVEDATPLSILRRVADRVEKNGVPLETLPVLAVLAVVALAVVAAALHRATAPARLLESAPRSGPGER
ncbi:ArnT family glycosyltransferase [Homoserinibacter sp. YIM 151385]|uniref:ArnT family glycosyltransferase n=1 Tax=Homoserinibacter sp. YIM 151385 TaxID=2985506 RepID=UPI0022F02AD3|nr:hypothetical protein [Homoserinibacter sp. YIM 151385]WBU37762.1 hypothetical protein OF852_12710 [Homoserinibacter sp. YIM 151385]